MGQARDFLPDFPPRPALSAVCWAQRYGSHINRYAENTPMDAFGLSTAMRGLHNTLTWTGEIAAQIPTKALALLHRRLLASASGARGAETQAASEKQPHYR